MKYLLSGSEKRPSIAKWPPQRSIRNPLPRRKPLTEKLSPIDSTDNSCCLKDLPRYAGEPSARFKVGGRTLRLTGSNSVCAFVYSPKYGRFSSFFGGRPGSIDARQGFSVRLAHLQLSRNPKPPGLQSELEFKDFTDSASTLSICTVIILSKCQECRHD